MDHPLLAGGATTTDGAPPPSREEASARSTDTTGLRPHLKRPAKLIRSVGSHDVSTAGPKPASNRAAYLTRVRCGSWTEKVDRGSDSTSTLLQINFHRRT
jgi:hypothetical protein